MMTWTDERIEALKRMWEAGQTASQIAEELGGVSRNAVIGKAHRLELQARPSPVRPNEPAPVPAAEPEETAVEAVAEAEVQAEPEPEIEPESEVEIALEAEPEAETEPQVEEEVMIEAEPAGGSEAGSEPELVAETDAEEIEEEAAPPSGVPPTPNPREAVPQPMMRSVGPGGFVRQSPGEQQPPATPAPPRRLVPAKPSPSINGKTTLLDLSDKICKWPLGHPGEPDFHFCGDKVNPGFPYCVQHCGHAYQAQLPRRDRRGPPPLPFGGPRAR